MQLSTNCMEKFVVVYLPMNGGWSHVMTAIVLYSTYQTVQQHTYVFSDEMPNAPKLSLTALQRTFCVSLSYVCLCTLCISFCVVYSACHLLGALIIIFAFLHFHCCYTFIALPSLCHIAAAFLFIIVCRVAVNAMESAR